MSLWGKKTGNEHKPTWLSAEEKARCYATAAGWVLKHPGGSEELLVAMHGLATKLAGSTVTEIQWDTRAWTAGQTRSIKLVFNEKVNFTGSPTVAVTKSTGGTVTATFASLDANKVVATFNFVVPAAATVLSVAAQSITLAGGTILEVVAPNAAADLAITAPVAAAAKTKTAV